MNQFRVECSEVNFFTILVEAETKDKAEEIKKRLSDHLGSEVQLRDKN